MDLQRLCGCKGIRSCILCKDKLINHFEERILKQENLGHMYCSSCNKNWPGWDNTALSYHPYHSGDYFYLPGIKIWNDFITKDEEEILVHNIDSLQWDLSQSGRKKQNFGPKCNFKKKKLKVGNFQGFPLFTEFIINRMHTLKELKNYQVVEQCALEYLPERGSHIDPHVDDCWIWGERIVTLSMLSLTYLTLTPLSSDCVKYNLEELKKQPSLSIHELKRSIDNNLIIRIPMPRRSLLCLFGPARYFWEHSILSNDISDRRICLTYREFSELYLTGDLYNTEGRKILEISNNFISNINSK